MKIDGLQELVLECQALKIKHKEIKAEADKRASVVWSEHMQKKSKIVDVLKAHDLKVFDTGQGKATLKEHRSLKIVDKERFYDYLVETDRFRDYANVTATKAASVFKDDMAVAIEDKDVQFLKNGVPGLEQSGVFEDVSLTGFKK